MSPDTVILKRFGNSKPRRRHSDMCHCPREDLDLRDFVDVRCLDPWVRDRHTLASDTIPDAELMPRVRSCSHSDEKLASLCPEQAADSEGVPLVGMMSLVERAGQTDTRLDRRDRTGPRNFA